MTPSKSHSATTKLWALDNSDAVLPCQRVMKLATLAGAESGGFIPAMKGKQNPPELLLAAQAEADVTRNLRDVARGELKFPGLQVLTPEQCLAQFFPKD